MPSNPEDIMAEYLLKGGKMLDKTCPSCGSPLFLVKGDTMCVVCNKAQNSVPPETSLKAPEQHEIVPEDYREMEYSKEGREMSGDLRAEMEGTIIYLCRRVREESRAKDSLALMECVKIANDVLKGR
ncbi:MAG: hypothetical protein JW931_00670 [Methanomicrobiaceae archaeon]|nr:hypothetical protein [Methanomicrobiaceae archaeon]